MPPLRRVVAILHCLVGVVLTTLVPLPTAHAAVPRIQVRGASRLDVQCSGPSNALRISGSLRDENGAAIVNRSLSFSAVSPPNAPISWSQISNCGSAASPSAAQTIHTADTDDTGAFCLQASLPQRNAVVRVEFAGDGLHDGTRSDILWDAAQRGAVLAFVRRPERIDLDLPSHGLEARLSVDKGSTTANLLVTLEDSSGSRLGAASTDSLGVVRFKVPSTAFVGPSIGELRLRFAGTSDIAPASASAIVTRFARVRLNLPAAIRGNPVSGIRPSIGVLTAFGPVASGTIEARVAQELVGTAPVQNGLAEILISFTPNASSPSDVVDFLYISDSPYYQAQAAQSVPLKVTRLPLPLRIVPVVVALGLAFWIFRGWWRPKRLERVTRVKDVAAGTPSLHVVAPAPSRGSWQGSVVDSYDGSAVADARVRVVAPSFVDTDVVAECRSDASGRFEFRIASYDRQLRLVVDSPLHVELDRALPPACDLSIAMVTRRRALLDRLVAWAKREGRPWDQTPEPTPGHIGRAALAGRHARADVANWAQKLEEKAYGSSAVLARDEREVRDIEPGPKAPR